MNITDLFKNSLSFPLSDYKKLLIVGVICVLSNISSIYASFGIPNSAIASVLGLVSFIFGLILGGYILSIIKDTIEGTDEIPDFEWKSNLVMGIKYIILEIIYIIIPTIIMLIIAYATGFFNATLEIMDNLNFDLITTTTNQTAASQAISNIPESTLATFAGSITILAIVGIILAIIFGILTLVGSCRLANTGSLKEGLNAKQIFKDISSIGWGSFIVWLIILIIIMIILVIISGLISMIPYVGTIIATLIVSSFVILFIGKAMGLMYASKD